MENRIKGRNPNQLRGTGSVSTLRAHAFDMHVATSVVTIAFMGTEDGPDRRRSIVQVELASADAEAPLDALQSGFPLSLPPQDEERTRPAGGEQVDSRSDRAGVVTHPGVHYTELGWTRKQFEEAAEDMSDLQDIWDHDELDVYNDLLKG